MRLFYTVLLLTLCLALTSTVLAAQDTQTPQATVKTLTNADVLDMLSAGLSQEIVIAKIAASACEFDTSPAALKVLKATNVPDAVILAMVQAPTGSRRQELTNAEPAPARIAESTQQGHSISESKKREDIQKAGDGLEDCRVRSQNEYDTKIGAISTMALAPMMRVAASARLKQNLDAELRECRSQYELRLKAIDEGTDESRQARQEMRAEASSSDGYQVLGTHSSSAFGVVYVSSNPKEAEIYVDYSFVSKAPATLNLKPGQHYVRAFLNDYKNWSRQIEIDAGSEAKLTITLQKSN